MKEKFKKQKGITLVALVITIIVLLILAMVSISIVMNQGIMTKSKDAADKYNEAANNEQEELTFFEKLFGKYSDGNSIGDNTVGESPYVTPRTEVTYKGQTLKVGDYVNYDEGKGYTWTTDSTKGTVGDYNSTSKTYTTENMSWRVLGLDKDGNLELISDKQTSEYLALCGKEGYLNGEEQLNEMCDTLYGKGTNAKSARSVNAEDINAILGYNKKKFTGETIGSQEYSNMRYGWKTTYYNIKTTWEPKNTFWIEEDSNEYIRQGNVTTFINIDGNIATDEAPITVESTWYRYRIEEFIDKVNSNMLDMIFGIGCSSYSGNNFWLASQYVYGYYDSAEWSLFYISNDGTLFGGSALYRSSGQNGSYGNYIRPVVTLKSGVQLSGNSTDGWTIQ